MYRALEMMLKLIKFEKESLEYVIADARLDVVCNDKDKHLFKEKLVQHQKHFKMLETTEIEISKLLPYTKETMILDAEREYFKKRFAEEEAVVANAVADLSEDCTNEEILKYLEEVRSINKVLSETGN